VSTILITAVDGATALWEEPADRSGRADLLVVSVDSPRGQVIG
jgi:hypothetical protein